MNFKIYARYFLTDSETIVENDDGVLYIKDIRSPQFYESYEELWNDILLERVREIRGEMNERDWNIYLLGLAGLDGLTDALGEELDDGRRMVEFIREQDLLEGFPQGELVGPPHFEEEKVVFTFRNEDAEIAYTISLEDYRLIEEAL